MGMGGNPDRKPILICESDPRNADVLSYVIETRRWFVVTQVDSAYDAIETMMLVPDKFFLVLANQLLKGSDGLELTKRIKQLWPQQPVLIYNPCISCALPPDCLADISRIVFDIHHMRPMLEIIDILAVGKRGPKPAPRPVTTS
jgi:hypothetical protein